LVVYSEVKPRASDEHRGDENKMDKNYKYITCHFHHKCKYCACGTREICERNPTVLTEYKHVHTHTHTDDIYII